MKRVIIGAALFAVAGMAQAELVGHWKFDETQGNTAVDATGNGFDGTVSGSPVWAEGVDGGALRFDGSSVSVAINNALGSVSNELTIAFWCYGDEGKKTQQNAFSTPNRELHAHFPWDGPTIYYDAGATTRNRLQFGVSDDTLLWGKWNHWVFTKNVTDGTMAVYVNGSETPIASGTGKTDTLAGLPATFYIGSDAGSGLFYKGLIDDFRIYNNELTTTEISNLYHSVSFDFATAVAEASPNTGAPPLEVAFSGANSVSSTNIVSYSWDFGDGTLGSGVNATNTYAAEGDYTATLVIEDANGLNSTGTVDVAVAHFISANTSVTPTSGQTPLVVVFDGSGSTSSTGIVSYDWDFGDNTGSTGMMATNTYTMTGVYTSSLVVVDSQGLIDTNTTVITVRNIVNVDYTVTAEEFADVNPPSFRTNDLAQTKFLSSTGTGEGSATTDTSHALLFDGTIGNTDGSISGAGEVRWNSTSTVTVEFDLTDSPYGYDLTEIASIAGWAPGAGGRANQGYGVYVTYFDDVVATLFEPQHWAPNTADTNYWTKVTFVEASGGVLAKNVKSVTFDISQNANANGDVVGREIDILGVPSVEPAPSEIVIEAGGSLDSMSWASERDYAYLVQTNIDLAFGTWGTLETVIGTPPTTTYVLPEKSAKETFYRVLFEGTK